MEGDLKGIKVDQEYLEKKGYSLGIQIPLPPIEQKALRYNDGKLRWSLVHWKSLEPMVQQLMFGEKKYSRNNWQKGMKISSILDSLDRHKVELSIDPFSIDEDSGLSHVAGLLCNAMFLSYYITTEEGKKKIIPEDD